MLPLCVAAPSRERRTVAIIAKALPHARLGQANSAASAAPGSARAHERLADQERLHAVRAHVRDVGGGQDAALGDDQPVGRNARQQIERRRER